MKLDEPAIRAKVIELYDRMSQHRMDMWLFSGISAGVIDANVAERVMNEEIWKRSRHVREYWMGEPCNCNGSLN